ncbi:DUF1330 domain-containing protein [Thalassomonas actiniarum]|uniref:DUF1330 domain-containing protein n=1 Tax=Thalassomonas actiniarum TaxID=485447 RepID=A0AAE9YVC6_9GAMM|nr:DUF1330 domain-containing protein [Thalassomonas actiniarum]WDE01518.1 DUF1330 domain-containing protein [Thalassomonas actiniarum]
MAYEMLVALEVIDDENYQAYRQAMKPILTTYGGGFGADFRVSEVLLPQESPNINRVFTIYFRDEAAKNDFFADGDYLKVKAEYFETSVASTRILASYGRE